MTMQKMVDVSANNHGDDAPINWQKVAKSGVRAVMIKATQGTDYVDPWLQRDAHGARAAGLHVGFYHFGEPGAEILDGPGEANYCLQKIEGLPRDLGVALDLEVTNGSSWSVLARYAQAFLDTLDGKVTNRAIYLNNWFLSNLPGAPFGAHLWLADPGHKPRRTVWAWQSDWHGVVPGIPGTVDLDVLYS
jgi:lysozyme